MEKVLKTQFITSSNFDILNCKGEENSGEIVTIPDMSYSIEEILRRSFSGSLPSIAKESYYDSENGDVDFDDTDPTMAPDFDLVDAQVLSEQSQGAHTSSKTTKSVEASGQSVGSSSELTKDMSAITPADVSAV